MSQALLLQAVRESDTLPAELVDRTVMGEPIQQGRRERGIAEDARPVRKGQV